MLAGLAGGGLRGLKRHGFLRCGEDWLAEDLVKEALVRAFSRRFHGPRPGTAEAYVRKVMVNLFIDQSRRRSRWTRAAPLQPRAEPVPDIAEQVAIRDAVLTAMDGLSARQRACVVLRVYEDLLVRRVAGALGVQWGRVT